MVALPVIDDQQNVRLSTNKLKSQDGSTTMMFVDYVRKLLIHTYHRLAPNAC